MARLISHGNKDLINKKNKEGDIPDCSDAACAGLRRRIAISSMHNSLRDTA
ncbi:hypothetical protein D083_3929 [Dickeya solani RNS 08.23.3.1.A]|nr:hypothetical protein D083_3929 [Dickeya solani RNS 08.23.3.1.A]